MVAWECSPTRTCICDSCVSEVSATKLGLVSVFVYRFYAVFIAAAVTGNFPLSRITGVPSGRAENVRLLSEIVNRYYPR